MGVRRVSVALLAFTTFACTDRSPDRAAPGAPDAAADAPAPPAAPGSGSAAPDACAASAADPPADATCSFALAPLPEEVRLSKLVPAGWGCGPGVSDGEGRFVALPSVEGGSSLHSYEFVPMQGGGAGPNVVAGREELVPQPRGHHLRPLGSVFTPPRVRARELTVYDAEGGVTAVGGTLGAVVTLFAVPGGGSVAVTAPRVGDVGGVFRLERVGTDGSWISAYEIGPSWNVDVVAVNQRRHVLIATEPARFRWLDETLTPLTDWFDPPVGAHGYPVGAAGLADGSVRFSSDRVLRDGDVAFTCAAPWLRKLPPAVLVSVLGGRAYALLPRWDYATSPPTCPRAALEVLSTDGVPCGELSLPVSPCDVSVGADGTVFAVSLQLGQATPENVFPPNTCTWRWWPGLLR